MVDGFHVELATRELVELAGMGNPQWKCWGGDWRRAADMFRERLELNVGTFKRQLRVDLQGQVLIALWVLELLLKVLYLLLQ